MEVIVYNWREELIAPDKIEIQRFYKHVRSEYISEGCCPETIRKAYPEEKYEDFDGVYIGW